MRQLLRLRPAGGGAVLAVRPLGVLGLGQNYGTVATESVWHFVRSMSVSQWLLVLHPIMMTLVKRRRGPEEAFSVDYSAMVQIVYTLACAAWLSCRFVSRFRELWAAARRPPLRWVLLYGVLAIISTAWSDVPMYTLFRSFQYLVFFGLIVDTTWHQRSVDRMAKLLAIYGLILIVFFQIADLSVNAFAMRERIGPHVSPTSGVVFFLGLALRGPGWRALVYLSLLSVAIGQSAGTNVSMAAGLFVLALIGRDQKLRLASLTILMLFSLLALVRSEFAGSVLFPQKGTQAIYTMSGRIPVWQWFLWDIFPKRPWVGYAFGTGESVSRLENVRGLQMTHMHNPLISALANLGSIGGLVYLVTMFSTASVAIHITNSRWKGPVCAAITLITLNSQQGVSISSTVSTAWITSCLLLALLSTTPQEARSGQESLLRRKDQTGCFRRA